MSWLRWSWSTIDSATASYDNLFFICILGMFCLVVCCLFSRPPEEVAAYNEAFIKNVRGNEANESEEDEYYEDDDDDEFEYDNNDDGYDYGDTASGTLIRSSKHKKQGKVCRLQGSSWLRNLGRSAFSLQTNIGRRFMRQGRSLTRSTDLSFENLWD